jgi:ergothioneine biosynthesis protein EgtB
MNPITEKYTACRARTLTLCKPLKTEDYIPQPVAFVSPAKWHLAHTTWFFEEFVLSKNVPGYGRFHADYSYLFNSYYNSVGERTLRADRGNLTRPTVEEVYAFRAHVDAHMRTFLKQKISKDVRDLVMLGINHEQQHQELLITDLKYILGHNPTFPLYAEGAALVNDQEKEHGWLLIDEGVYEIGFGGDGFCYDNELGRHKVYLQDFEISKSLVSNGEYMQFIKAGGYENFDLWLDDGWAWIQTENITSPLYWHLIDDEWYQFTLGGLKKVDPGEILCHVSFYEAAAYAEWKGMRLPTEFEWEIASGQLDWGKRWEWTNSAYLPYPQFNKAAGAIGEYNGKFMVNQMVLRGASVATSSGHGRSSYRNFFQPYYQWQFSGIRLAK